MSSAAKPVTLKDSQARLEQYAVDGKAYGLQQLDTMNVLSALILTQQLLADCKAQLDVARGVTQ